MQSIKIKISKLKNNNGQIEGVNKNPRIQDDAKFQKLKKSLQDFPEMLELRELVVFPLGNDFIVVGGNMRLKALKELGEKEAVCKVLPADFTPEKINEFIIKDNVSFGLWDNTELSEWDAELLNEWGFEVPEWENATELEAVEDNYQVPDTIHTDIVIGDLITFEKDGKELHRLMCGDSTNSDSVAKLMDGKRAGMVFTDPPYKIQTEGGCKGVTGKALRKQGKDIELIADFNPSEFLNILPIVFENKIMNAYIFCNKDLLPDYLFWAKETGYSFNVLIWKKPNAIPIGDSHRPDIEYLLLFRKSAIWNNAIKGVNYSRCLEFGRESGLHPTMKPIELISNEMQISSNIGSLIIDFFLGSGSTMVAAHQLNRKCYGMELDEKYCQVIIDRMTKLDSELVVKINGLIYEKAAK